MEEEMKVAQKLMEDRAKAEEEHRKSLAKTPCVTLGSTCT